MKHICSCGNNNRKETKTYQGGAEYQVVVCKRCGCYHDGRRFFEADIWSLDFVGLEKASVLLNQVSLNQSVGHLSSLQ